MIDPFQTMANIGGLFVFFSVVLFAIWATLVMIFTPIKKKRNNVAERTNHNFDAGSQEKQPVDINSRRRSGGSYNSIFDR